MPTPQRSDVPQTKEDRKLMYKAVNGQIFLEVWLDQPNQEYVHFLNEKSTIGGKVKC